MSSSFQLKTRCAVGVVLFAWMTLFPGVARAERLTSYDATVQIRRDGSLMVNETVQLDLEGAWRRGVERDIAHRTATGEPLQIRVLNVLDSAGRPIAHQVVPHSGFTRLHVGDLDRPVSGQIRFEVQYLVEGAVGLDGAGTVLAWSPTGVEWLVPIDHASVRVRPPSGVAFVEAPGATIITGAGVADPTGLPGTEERDGAWRFETEDIPAGGGVFVSAHLPASATQHASFLTRWMHRLTGLPQWPVLPLLLGLALMLNRHRRRRTPNGEATSYVAIPSELTPAEVGVVWRGRVGLDDLVATVFHLAARGHITIEPLESSRRFFFQRRNFQFTRHRNVADTLLGSEQLMLDVIFEMSDVVLASSLRGVFYRELPRLRDAIYEQVAQRGLIVGGPVVVRGRYWLAAWGVALLGLCLLFVSAVSLGVSLALFTCAGVLAVAGPMMPLRTANGVGERQRLQGLVNGIRTLSETGEIAEAPAFDHLFGFALTLGVADAWTAAHEAAPVGAPFWLAIDSEDAREVAQTMGELGRTLAAAMRARADGFVSRDGFLEKRTEVSW